MCRSILTLSMVLFIAALAGALPAQAEVPVYPGQPSGEFLRTWLLCGPIPLEASQFGESFHLEGFNTDTLEAIGGEKAPVIDEGTVIEVGSEKLVWKRYTSPEDILDLDAAISKQDPVAAYAYCEVESDREQLAILSIGSNDGGRAWLNGEQVWNFGAGRGVTKDDDLITVVLRKGRNTLLAKLEDKANIWGFCARFLPFEPKRLKDHFALFQVHVNPEGEAALRFVHPASVSTSLVEKVDLALEKMNPDGLVWRKPWNGEAEMPLELSGTACSHYALTVSARLLGGVPWNRRLVFMAGKRTEHVLFENGQSAYSIVVGEEASESELWAAQELAHWLKEASSADFPVLQNPETLPEKAIVLGWNRHAAGLLDSTETPAELDESFIYKNVGAHIVIVGGKARGTMYGVFSFLENELGCRWYTPRVTVIPAKARYSFDRLYGQESPGVRGPERFLF